MERAWKIVANIGGVNMFKRFKKVLLLMLLISVAVPLVACGGDRKGKSSSKAKDDYQINLGYYNCDHMVGACIGEATGIYEKMGLNVKITGNGKVPEAMAAGQMDAGYIGTRGLVGANAKGSPIVIGASNHTGGSLYLVTANDIEKPEELYGKKVAIGSPSTNEGWLVGYSKLLNLSTKDEDYDLVNIGSDADKYTALSRGEISAFTACDPWGSMAVYDGSGKIMATYMEMDDKMGVCCSFSLNKKFVEEHPDLAKKLLKAHEESIKFCYTNPKEAAKIFAEYYKVPEEVAMMTIHKKCVEEGRTLTWAIEEENFKHAYDIYEEYDLIETLPKFEDLINYDIYNEAKLDNFDEFIKSEVDNVFPIGMSYEDFKVKAEELSK